MSRQMDRIAREAAEKLGPAPTNPTEALTHFLTVYAEQPDSWMIREATHGIYGDRVVTGLTMGDLRAIANLINQHQQPAADQSGIYDDGGSNSNPA